MHRIVEINTWDLKEQRSHRNGVLKVSAREGFLLLLVLQTVKGIS
jgi:hypothetical protein